ncbi:hypothetical protein BV25DRAFT_122329 [Artomyces pyxidatus]|uniref:Uncharacterized protein n=1 Tax=Artomyces pyxidatus TaxID=48021 RepID=A0ACB8TLL4_9AGAM|nr:hypothetical protein BV25DRAFT_122329 [Artomyces pyxidatus]
MRKAARSSTVRRSDSLGYYDRAYGAAVSTSYALVNHVAWASNSTCTWKPCLICSPRFSCAYLIRQWNCAFNLTQAPFIVYRGLGPVLHMNRCPRTAGQLAEATLVMDNPKLKSSIDSLPIANLSTNYVEMAVPGGRYSHLSLYKGAHRSLH